MTEPFQPSPDWASAIDSLARAVDRFSDESADLRETVERGTEQRVRLSRYAVLFAVVSTILVVVLTTLTVIQINTIAASRQQRNEQYQASVEDRARIEALIKEQNNKAAADRANTLKAAIIASYCGSSTESVADFKSCLTRNGLPVPSDLALK